MGEMSKKMWKIRKRESTNGGPEKEEGGAAEEFFDVAEGGQEGKRPK